MNRRFTDDDGPSAGFLKLTKTLARVATRKKNMNSGNEQPRSHKRSRRTILYRININGKVQNFVELSVCVAERLVDENLPLVFIDHDNKLMVTTPSRQVDVAGNYYVPTGHEVVINMDAARVTVDSVIQTVRERIDKQLTTDEPEITHQLELGIPENERANTRARMLIGMLIRDGRVSCTGYRVTVPYGIVTVTRSYDINYDAARRAIVVSRGTDTRWIDVDTKDITSHTRPSAAVTSKDIKVMDVFVRSIAVAAKAANGRLLAALGASKGAPPPDPDTEPRVPKNLDAAPEPKPGAPELTVEAAAKFLRDNGFIVDKAPTRFAPGPYTYGPADDDPDKLRIFDRNGRHIASMVKGEPDRELNAMLLAASFDLAIVSSVVWRIFSRQRHIQGRGEDQRALAHAVVIMDALTKGENDQFLDAADTYDVTLERLRKASGQVRQFPSLMHKL